MGKLDVAYGVLDSVSDQQLLAAFRVVTDNFDESPTRMHVVLGPPKRGMRWFTFACANIGPGTVLAQDHFTESIGDLLELTVATRSRYSDDVRGFDAPTFALELDDGIVRVHRGGLPADARRDGALDQVGLAALGVPDAIRPFDALDKPTHEVVLRDARARPENLAIRPLDGPVLPTRVKSRLGTYGQPVDSFALAPRAVATGDPAALTAHFATIAKTFEAEWVAHFENNLVAYARDVVRAGSAIAPVLEAALEAAGPKPRTSRVALASLALLGRGAPQMIAWAAKTSEQLAHAGYCALAALGEAARPALVDARESKKRVEREIGESLLPLLDGNDWAPIRAARTSPLYAALRDNLGSKLADYEYYALVKAAPDDAMWGLAAFLVDVPLIARGHFANYVGRDQLVRVAGERFGAAFGPVADVLLRFRPFANDPVLVPLARGAKPPSDADIVNAIIAKNDAARKANKKKKAAKAAKTK